MTVSELIAELQKLSPGAVVCRLDEYTWFEEIEDIREVFLTHYGSDQAAYEDKAPKGKPWIAGVILS